MRISDAVGLWGIEVRLGYDEDLFAIADASAEFPGVQVHQGQAPVVDFEARNRVDDGEICYAVTQIMPREPFNGDGVVFWFEATPLRPGIAQMTFDRVMMIDGGEQGELDFETVPAVLDVGHGAYLPLAAR